MNEAPPSPRNILRGHKAQVHAAAFVRRNERLATGDAEGYVVLWDLTIMRPRAVWRAHENAILGIRGWQRNKLITHGRDHKLLVWQVSESDEERLSKSLPLEDSPGNRPQPWLVHALEVNTMNFCSFAACSKTVSRGPTSLYTAAEIWIAVPNTLASEAIDIYELPSQARHHTVKPGEKNGMAMSLGLTNGQTGLTLIAAFENGFASVHCLDNHGRWTMTYRTQAHSQPVLSLDIDPDGDFFLTSGADSVVAKHPIPASGQPISAPMKAGERVTELPDDPADGRVSLLSAGLKSSAGNAGAREEVFYKEWEHPLKVINTKHSGQQSLAIRGDRQIFATAGWDSNIRVYSVRSMKELAVLQWHKVGSYAVAFAELDVATDDQAAPAQGLREVAHDTSEKALDKGPSSAIVNLSESRTMSVKNRRLQKAKTAHWIAAGAKDGKVSLWDIY